MESHSLSKRFGYLLLIVASLQENNTSAMRTHLKVAFTAVTISVAAACLTFWIANVKKRWYAEELANIEPPWKNQHPNSLEP